MHTGKELTRFNMVHSLLVFPASPCLGVPNVVQLYKVQRILHKEVQDGIAMALHQPEVRVTNSFLSENHSVSSVFTPFYSHRPCSPCFTFKFLHHSAAVKTVPMPMPPARGRCCEDLPVDPDAHRPASAGSATSFRQCCSFSVWPARTNAFNGSSNHRHP